MEGKRNGKRDGPRCPLVGSFAKEGRARPPRRASGALLPRQASPTKVADDDQHKNDDDDDPNPGHMILSLGTGRLYGESAPICNARGLATASGTGGDFGAPMSGSREERLAKVRLDFGPNNGRQ